MSRNLTSSVDFNLAFLLLNRYRWFQRQLQPFLERMGVPELTTTQQMIAPYLDPEGTSISELARRVGVTRQAIHQTVNSMVKAGFVDVVPAPHDKRLKLVRLSKLGHRVDREAVREIHRLEAALSERLGKKTVATLRKALEEDWG